MVFGTRTGGMDVSDPVDGQSLAEQGAAFE